MIMIVIILVSLTGYYSLIVTWLFQATFLYFNKNIPAQDPSFSQKQKTVQECNEHPKPIAPVKYKDRPFIAIAQQLVSIDSVIHVYRY